MTEALGNMRSETHNEVREWGKLNTFIVFRYCDMKF